MIKQRINPFLIKAAVYCVVLLLGAVIGGLVIYGYSGHQNRMISKTGDKSAGLLTDKIAIVNLDDGVIVRDEEINYAEQLLIDPKDNFLFTGLEDARQGYATGIYAGYVIIPANFSDSVVSLNDTPVRAEITYAINNELQEDVKDQVIYDVFELVDNLNDNVSYMYMHSVLDDLHTAQDEADKIMSNDLKEKETIEAVKAYDLVALVPVTELTEIENTIEPVDISEYMAKNMEFTGVVGQKYAEYMMASEEEHQRINEESIGLIDEMNNTSSIISSISLVQNEEDGTVYQSGEEELDKMLEEYGIAFGETVAEQEENIMKIYQDINLYLDEYDRALEAHRSRNSVLYRNTLDALESLFDRYKADGYTIVSEQEIQSMRAQIQHQSITIANQQSLIEELGNKEQEKREQEDGISHEDIIGSGDNSVQNTDGNIIEDTVPDESNIGETEINEEITSFILYVNADANMAETVDSAMVNNEDQEDKLSQLQNDIVKILEGNNYYIFGGTLLDQDGKPMQDEDGEYIPVTSILELYEKELYLDNGKPDIEVWEEILEEQMAEFEQIDTAKVMACIDEHIITPIQENVNAIATRVLDQYAVEQEQLMTYNEAIMEYNPLEYINHEEMQLLTGQMLDNGVALSEAVLETDIQQMEYVTNVYMSTRADLFTLQESIVTAKEDSDKAVEEGLQEVKDTKNANSAMNQEILDDFSKKLPYTRLGSLEYVQAYEFMINPIGRIDMGEREKIPRTQQDSVRSASDNINVEEKKKADTRNVSMLICVMICVIIVAATIKYHFHKKEESYDME